jgi:hypothetical protein
VGSTEVIAARTNLSWNTLVVNSLIETNMGLPYLYLIHRALKKRGRTKRLEPAGGVEGV